VLLLLHPKLQQHLANFISFDSKKMAITLWNRLKLCHEFLNARDPAHHQHRPEQIMSPTTTTTATTTSLDEAGEKTMLTTITRTMRVHE
jgi:hypothetical protein